MESDLDVLLVELPFVDIDRPSLGLSLLKAELLRSGFRCEILYASIRFAPHIGADLYRLIASSLPQDLLIGDRVFTDPCDGYPNGAPHETENDVPPLLRDQFELLKFKASDFAETIADEIVELKPKLVGFSTLFQTVPSISVARKVKARNPKLLTIAGGSNCESGMGLHLFKNYPQFDFICRGPGEILLPSLVTQLGSHEPSFAKIDGLLWRGSDEAVHINQEYAKELSLDKQSIPDFSDWLEQLESVFRNIERKSLWLPIESSRGCWWGQKRHCVFCGLNGSTMDFRQKSPHRLIAELEVFRKYEIPNIYATDLIFPYKYYQNFLPQFSEHPLSKYYSFFYEIKSNIKKDQLRQLRKAGVKWLQPGVEALDTEILDIMEKGVDSIQQLQLLKWAAELGITLTWNLLYGLGSQRAYERSAKLIASITHLSPPSTGCYKIRVDRFSPMFDEWQRFSNRPPEPAPAYFIIHSMLGADVKHLAYHFQYDNPPDEVAVNTLKESVRSWEAAVGRASFVQWDDECGNLHLSDRRGQECAAHTVLTGETANLYRKLDEGRARNHLAREIGSGEAFVRDGLQRFAENGWAIEVDGKFLALSCDYTAQAHYIPESLRPTALHVLHTERVWTMWKQGRERKDLLNRFNTSNSSNFSYESMAIS
jgi:ribosomal peptide maturation radical SAM protein 1